MQRPETTSLSRSFQEEIPHPSLPLNTTTPDNLQSFKQVPNLAALPEVPPAFDFWGVLPVTVDQNHLVTLIILAKVISNLDESALPGILPPLWAETQALQTRLLSSQEKAEQFAAMLSRAIVPPTSTEGGVEVIFGPDRQPGGFSLGDAHVQAVMTCVILADEVSPPDPSALFPFVANDIVDTYVLPANTDLLEFGRYLTEKHQQLRRGKHLPVISTKGFNNPRLVSDILTYGATGSLIYSLTAFLFMEALLSSAPFVIYGSPFPLLFVVGFAVALWKRNSRAGQLAASNYIRAMSSRPADYTPEVVQEISSRFTPLHAAQFSYELNAKSSSN